MHNKDQAVYRDFFPDVLRETARCVQTALDAGVSPDKIILDPGIGFGKTYEMNLETIHHLERFHALGYPLLLGTSRKSVIGLTLDLPAGQRLEGTLVTHGDGGGKRLRLRAGPRCGSQPQSHSHDQSDSGSSQT